MFLLFFYSLLIAKTSSPYLYDHAKKDGVPAKKLLSSRLYFVKDPDFNKWLFTITDEKANLENPIYYLSEGTVLKPSYAGLKDSTKNLKLQKEGTWVETNENPIFVTWVKKMGLKGTPVVYLDSDAPPKISDGTAPAAPK